MTQRELIDYCNTWTGWCAECKHTNTCNKYREKYGEVPFWNEVLNPERYTEEEV